MFRNKVILIVSLLMILVLAACGNNEANEDELDELKMLEVDFEVPETAEVDEAVELNAHVTYGDEAVADVDEIDFEIWEMCDEDNSVHEIPKNNEDGSYTLEYTFDDDGVYEIYAHTTAHDMHTMPKKQITIGAGGDYDCEENEDAQHEEHDMNDTDEDE